MKLSKTMISMNKLVSKFFQWAASLPLDKVLHVLCGLLLFMFSSSSMLALTGLKILSLVVGFIVVVSLGFWKEWMDCKGNWTTYDYKDFIATLLGGLIGSLQIFILWSRF